MNDEISFIEDEGIETPLPLLYIDRESEAKCVYSILSVEDFVQCYIEHYAEAVMFYIPKEKITEELHGVTSITYEMVDTSLCPTLHFDEGSDYTIRIEYTNDENKENTIAGLKGVVEECAPYIFITRQTFKPEDVCFEGEHWAVF